MNNSFSRYVATDPHNVGGYRHTADCIHPWGPVDLQITWWCSACWQALIWKALLLFDGMKLIHPVLLSPGRAFCSLASKCTCKCLHLGTGKDRNLNWWWSGLENREVEKLHF